MDNNGNNTGNYQYEPSVLGLIAGQALEAKFNFLYRPKKNILPYSCAVSFKKLCLEELNYFDEDAFKVLEADNDLSMRIHRSKWKLLFTKKIAFCHEGGNSYKVNYKRVLLFYESRWKLLKKHKLIRFPALSKELMKARVMMELIILKMLLAVKSGSDKYKERLHGRKILLKEINYYK